MTSSIARAPWRSGFDRPPLIGALAGTAPVEAIGPGRSVAERLGDWLGFTDALSVFAALQPAAAGPAEDASAACRALREEIRRLRDALAGVPAEPAADFAALQRFYQARQRDMAARIGPLRARARAVLAAASPGLRRLAALDEALERAWTERERELLAVVPGRLEQRFNELREQVPAAGGRLFQDELQAALRAELETRLQPVLGLVEAGGGGEEGRHEP